jgi:protein-S-isoprenylcysteine O-methyltransferase Ste14
LNFSEKVYKWRGFILGVLAILLLLLEPSHDVISVSAFLLFIAGFFLRVTARRNIGIHSRSLNVEAPQLVKDGIYQKLRHPLYFSNGLFASGFLLLHLGWQNLTFPIATFVWLFLFFLAKNEDDFLHKKFGSEWETWASSTPFMFFNLKGLKNLKFERSFFDAFLEDKWTWFFLSLYAALIFLRRYFS